MSSLEKAMELCPDNEEAFVIGGGEIYQQALDLVDKIDVTRVHTTIDADTFFPEIDTNTWKLVFEEFHPKHEKHLFDFTFLTYVRR